jgi:hypothetical protein
METAELVQRREDNRIKRRRRGATVAIGSGAVVLLLVMGVFSVASTSRSVAQESSKVHALDEILRSITVIRAQLGFGLVLEDLDRTTAIDASSAANAAADDVAASIEDLDRSVDFIADDLDGFDRRTSAAISSFKDRIDQIRIEASTTALPTEELIASFESAYDETILFVSSERDIALGLVADADADLSRLGTLVNFLVAFVVPTVAFGIYRALTRPETDLLLADAQSVKDSVLRLLRRDLLIREIDELETAVEELHAPETLGPTPRERVAALRATVLTLDRAHETSFSAVALNPAIHRVAARVDAGTTITISCSDELEVWSDPDVLELLLTSIVADCQSSGADRIAFNCTTADCLVVIRVAKNGRLRSRSELKLLSKQGTIAGRITLLGGPDTVVVSALHLADDIHGSLDLVGVGEQQSFVLELPTPIDVRPGIRTLVFDET